MKRRLLLLALVGLLCVAGTVFIWKSMYMQTYRDQVLMSLCCD